MNNIVFGFDNFRNLLPDGSDPKKAWAGVIIGMLFGLLICSLLSGCSTVKYVPVVERDTIITHQHDTLIQDRVVRDSVTIRDSIFESIFLKGDTVLQYKYVERTRLKDRLLHDSIYINKTDTVYKKVNDVQVVEVEKKLGWFDNIILRLGKFIFFIFILVICLGVAYPVYIYIKAR